MTSSTDPSRSPTSTPAMVLASAARASAATARAPQSVRPARRDVVRIMVLLLEVDRRFLREAEHGLRLFLRSVGADGPLGDHHLAGADGGDDSAVLPHAGAASHGVAGAVGRF